VLLLVANDAAWASGMAIAASVKRARKVIMMQ
jgi:hypothetical protein